MKLYAVPYGTTFRVRDEVGSVLDLRFHYIDGECVYCTTETNVTMCLNLWTDVEIVDGEAA